MDVDSLILRFRLISNGAVIANVYDHPFDRWFGSADRPVSSKKHNLYPIPIWRRLHVFPEMVLYIPTEVAITMPLANVNSLVADADICTTRLDWLAVLDRRAVLFRLQNVLQFIVPWAG